MLQKYFMLETSIKDLSATLLENDLDFSIIKETIDKIHENFKEHSPITGSENDIKNMAAVPTASGMALGLSHAAQCLIDYQRTTKLLRGVVSAIKDVQKKHPNETVNIFYAGCGPYAPFITLVAPLFSPEEVQFTLLEVNLDSLNAAKVLIEKLDLTQYVNDYYNKDAITFTIPNPESYHILFSETLDSLLYRESYVPILMNMLPQLNKDIVVVPENVVLDISIYDDVNSPTPSFQKEIFNVTNAINAEHDHKKFPSFEVELKPEYKGFLIDTTVRVYKDNFITRNESSVTIPCKVMFPQPLEHKKAYFTYCIKPQVELRFDYDEKAIELDNPVPEQNTEKGGRSSDRIKLPFNFDVDKLRAEYKVIREENSGYKGTIPLRAPAHIVDSSIPFPPPAEDYADGSWTSWLDTEFFKKSPYLNEVINTFKEHTTVNQVSLSYVLPNSFIQLRTEPTLALEEEKSMVRLTVPINNSHEEFSLNGTLVPMKAGECWYLRLSDPHQIQNKGDEEQVNLRIDMIPNEWLRNIIKESDE